MSETPDTPSEETAPDATPTTPAAPPAPAGSWAPPSAPMASTAPAPGGAQPTEPLPPHLQVPPTMPVGAPAASASAPRRRPAAVGIVAALAVGAIVGGVSGAGVALLTTQHSGSGSSSAQNPTTITVNDPGSATVVTAVAAKASPSVVTISVSTSSEGGTGSGVILSADGYILTNTHVVTLDGASSSGTVKVTLNDGRIFPATVVGTDPVSDLAVVKIDATGLTAATFADSSKLNVGDAAIAIGAPLGLSGTVTDGIVSALNRSITIASSAVPEDQSSTNGQDGGSDNPFDLWGFQFPGQGTQNQTPSTSAATISLAVIQTDAAINPGNSGGALLDSNGDVIGINVAIASAGDTSSTGSQSGSIGVGFAIPANLAQRVAKEIMATGTATHGLLGAQIVNSDSTSTDQSVAGAVIDKTTAGGAAEAAGLKAGDIVTGVDGVPIADYTDLTAQVRAHAAGDTVTITYVRGGQTATAQVTLGDLATQK